MAGEAAHDAGSRMVVGEIVDQVLAVIRQAGAVKNGLFDPGWQNRVTGILIRQGLTYVVVVPVDFI